MRLRPVRWTADDQIDAATSALDVATVASVASVRFAAVVLAEVGMADLTAWT
jgi:hypothetical protein